MKTIRLMVIGILFIFLSGCATGKAIHAAKGDSYYDKQGQPVERKPHAAYYMLVPLTVPFDIVFAPVEYVAALGDPGHW
jgi:hypothetical protein